MDDETKFVGFGEHHPADGNTADAAESQANRRVEMLLFEENHEPDLAVLKEAPEASEVYSPDAFRRAEIPERPGGARKHWTYEIWVHQPRFRKEEFEVFVQGTQGEYAGTKKVAGGVGSITQATFEAIPAATFIDAGPTGANPTDLIRQDFAVTRARPTKGIETPLPESKVVPEPRLEFLFYPKAES